MKLYPDALTPNDQPSDWCESCGPGQCFDCAREARRDEHEFDLPRAHDANPILIAMRQALGQGATPRDLLDDINGFQTGYPGADELQNVFEELFEALSMEEWRSTRVHARRVLYRWLAIFG